MRAVSLVLASILITGCATGTTTGTGEAPESSNAPSSPSTPQPTQTPNDAPAPELSPDSPLDSQPCEDVMYQRAQGTIRAQQSALANADFEAARAYASDRFRSAVTIEQFQQIIEGDYDFLLADPGLTFVDCQRRGDSALIRVEVAGSPVTVMAYGVVLENDSWFIDAASVIGSREAVTA